MISQQLLTIILIAIVVNAALIVAAVVVMRNSRTRSAARTDPEISATHDSSLAMATAGAGAGTGAVMGPLGRGATDTGTAAPSAPSAAWMTGQFDPAAAADGEPVGGASGEEPADGDDTGTAAPDFAEVPLHSLHDLEPPAAWRRAVEEEVVRLARYHRPATVMLIELDGFQRLTDRLGEAAGERLVRATAGTLKAQARAADRCGLLGRGRFAILLPETDDIQAINFGERVRAECDRWLEAGEVALRVAIGWASLDENDGAAAAIQEAERRLDAERRRRTGTTA